MSGSDWFLDYVIIGATPRLGYSLLITDRPTSRRGYNQPRKVYVFHGPNAHMNAHRQRPRPRF
jgi:hypothetical protein